MGRRACTAGAPDRFFEHMGCACRFRFDPAGMKCRRGGYVKPSRIAIYLAIAAVAAVLAYYYLVREPHPDWPINPVHLLFRH